MRALYLRLHATASADEDAATSREAATLVRTLAEELEADGAVARTRGGSGLEVVYPYDEQPCDGGAADGWRERALTELLLWLRGRLADEALDLAVVEERPVVLDAAPYHTA